MCDNDLNSFIGKYDKVVSDCSMLNKKLQQTQDQNQKDIETRIQVIMFMIMSTVKSILSRAVISLNY